MMRHLICSFQPLNIRIAFSNGTLNWFQKSDFNLSESESISWKREKLDDKSEMTIGKERIEMKMKGNKSKSERFELN